MEERVFDVPDGMPASVFRDKYARRNEDGSYQNWAQRITEVVAGNIALLPDGDLTKELQHQYLLKSALSGVVPFSGRHVQHGDLDQPTKKAELFYNCTSAMFSWASFLLLMKGCGVGRDFSSDICFVDWDYLPNCRFVLEAADNQGRGGHPDYEDWIETLSDALHKYDAESEGVRWHTVDDSAEGWAKVVMIMETAAFHKNNKDTVFVFDFSQVRKKGSPLRGQQNRPASGPVPFIRALYQVMSLKGAGMKPWKQAMFIDHYLAACVVVGGVRRSARIAIKSCYDRDVIDFIDIKRGGYLWSANNSIAVDAQFWGKAQNPRPSHERRVYEAAAGSSYWDDTGEPGFVNVDMLNDNREGLDTVTVDTYLSKSFIESIGGLHIRTRDMIGYHLERAKKRKYIYIPNPCVPGDTFVATAQGPKRVNELIGRPFTAMVNGLGYAASGFWKTGTRPVVKVTTNRGYSLRLTSNHKVQVEIGRRKKCGARNGYHIDTKWVEAGNLVTGDRVVLNDHRGFSWNGSNGVFDEGWLLGEMVGDGGFNPAYGHGSYVRFWGPHQKYMAEIAVRVAKSFPKTMRLKGTRSSPVSTSVSCVAMEHFAFGLIEPCTKDLDVDAIMNKGSAFVCGFIRGIFDADGTVSNDTVKGRSISLSQSNLKRLQQIQSMLLHVGVASTIYENRKPAGAAILPDGKGGNATYVVKASHSLFVTRSNMVVFMERIGFYEPDKRDIAFSAIDTIERGVYSERFYSTVVSVEDDGVEDVYDCSVSDVHAFDASGIVVHNCGEIPLAIWGAYCDIGDLCLANAKDEAEVFGAADVLARALVRVNTMPCMYEAETQRTNRIGVSLTGIHEFMWRVFGLTFRDSLDGAGEFWQFIEHVRDIVESGACAEASRLGLNIPATFTCVKPSGTISKVMQCTEGAHLPANRHYLRWVAFRQDDPRLAEHEKRGYPVKDVSHQYAGTSVVGFPTCLPIVNQMGEQLLVTASEATPAEQYKWLRLLEQHWLGPDKRNAQVSFTLKWRKSELSYEEYFRLILEQQPKVRCCSLMPQIEQDESAYAYLPEEPIDHAEYSRFVARITSTGEEAYDSDSLTCEGGVCPIEGDIHETSIGVAGIGL